MGIKAILAKTGWSQSAFALRVGRYLCYSCRWPMSIPCRILAKRVNQSIQKNVDIMPLEQGELAALFASEAQRKDFNIQAILQKEKLIEEFLLELTYHSDAIEGSTLTKKETEAVIFDKATVEDRSLIEHLEAVNHAQLLRDIFCGKFSGVIDEKMVKAMHRILMQGIRDDAGEYSKHHRAIRGVDLVLPSPQDIPEEMAIFFKKVNKIDGNPIEHIAQMHADFEAIHPFGDGNGRIGRLLMIVQLIKNDFAPCVIAVDEKAHYYEYLEYAQKRSLSHLAAFITEAVCKGYDIIKKL